MYTPKKEIEPLINWTSLRSYKDEVTLKKIHRHLTDINDTITEQDIRDIKLISISEVEMNISKNQIQKNSSLIM